jgi:putative ABC transport system permease protein
MTTSGLAVPGWGGVAASLLLVAVAAAVAYRQRLRLTRDIVVAAARAGLQLIAAGAILLVVFRWAGLPGAAGWVIAMVLIAGQVAGRRGMGLPRARVAATVGVATGTALTLVALLAGRVIATQPRVIVPVGGMIVSAAMLAAGIALRRLREEAHAARPAIEARLCLGQSAREAFLPHQRSALRTALIPAIDSTKVVGLISLPGAMTGLILAGVDPLTAIRYQIVVMYMLLAATALAALTCARLAERGLFDGAHRLVSSPSTASWMISARFHSRSNGNDVND